MLDKDTKIALIDDDVYWINKLTDFLNELDYHNIVAVTDPDELVWKTDVGCIFTDLNLYKTSGIEFVKELKFTNDTRHIPIIMATASGDAASKADAFCLGIHGWINKPYTLDDIREQLEKL